MNKLYLIFCFLLLGSGPLAAQQEGLYQFSQSYFRSQPFRGQFSSFVEHLMKDPDITEKQVRLRTDTSLFSFAGIYTTFNPFFFKPRRLEVSLQEVSFSWSDSSSQQDTILLYQLIAYSNPGEKGKKEMQKEFEKMYRKFKRRFFDSNYNQFNENTADEGAVCNYFVAFHPLSPLTIAWGRLEGADDPILSITLRIKISENQAVLPKPLDNP